jgi:hypothetical protein
MIDDAWHPADERMAASGLAVFVEWLRASGRRTNAEPAQVLAWAHARGPDFDAAIHAFMGWDTGGPVVCPGRDRHDAVIDRDHRAWTYDALPPTVTAALSAADAVGLAAHHLLVRGTRPDDQVPWSGDPSDIMPLGALYVGATVVVAG